MMFYFTVKGNCTIIINCTFQKSVKVKFKFVNHQSLAKVLLFTVTKENISGLHSLYFDQILLLSTLKCTIIKYKTINVTGNINV